MSSDRNAWRLVVYRLFWIGIVLAPLTVGGLWVWQKHQWALARMSELEPRYARMLGLLAQAESIKSGVDSANQYLVQHVYPSTTDSSQTGNDLQQRIRTLFVQHQMNVISMQVTPSRDEGAFERVSVTIRVEGDLSALKAALSGVPSIRPDVLIDTVNIASVGAVRPASVQRLTAQLGFSVLRLKS